MEEPIKMNRLSKSWHLTRAAWHSLRMDKELLALPIIGFFISLAVLLTAGGVAALNPGHIFFAASTAESDLRMGPYAYAGILIVGLVLAVVSSYISGAVIYGAIERFKGNDPTIKGSLLAARKRLGSLALFTAFSYGIGLILSEIASRIPFLGGKIVAWLANTAWNVATFFAIPVIVTSEEPVDPLKATKKSVDIIKSVWGESLIASATVGLIALLSVLAYAGVTTLALIAGASVALPEVVLGVLSAVAFVGIVIFALVFNVMQSYIKAAIYYYAVTGESPISFDKRLLRQSFTSKKPRKVFGI